METRSQWMKEFSERLSDLPEDERRRAIDYYNELFEDKYESGMSEKQIIDSFGSPAEAAAAILDEYAREGNGAEDKENRFFVGKESDYSEIRADLDYADIRVSPTADEKLSLILEGKNFEVEDENGILTIRKKKSFLSLFSRRAAVKLFVPQGMKCDYNLRTEAGKVQFASVNGGAVTLETLAGYVLCHDVKAHMADIRTEAGAATVKNVAAEQLAVRTDAGSFKGEDITANSAVIKMSTGKLQLDRFCGTELIAKTSTGAINLSDAEAKYITAESDVGAITGVIIGREQEYSIRAESSLGSCNLSRRDGETERTLDVKTSIGKINITFRL